jgi:hypothetical protein
MAPFSLKAALGKGRSATEIFSIFSTDGNLLPVMAKDFEMGNDLRELNLSVLLVWRGEDSGEQLCK